MSYCKHGQRITEIGHCTFCYEELRTQLAESEQACAGYRAALEKLVALEDEYPTLPRDICNAKQKVKVAWVESYRAGYEAARQALGSNPGKAVGDVIAALQSKCAKMRELLGECRANLAPQRIEATPCLAYRIDAILESEE